MCIPLLHVMRKRALGSPRLSGKGRIAPPCSVPRKKILRDTIAFG